MLNSTDVIHWRILAFLGAQLQIPAPPVASLRALYPRHPTLHEHQQLAKALLGFKKLIEPARWQLVAHLRQARGAATDAAELLIGARQWLYEHGYLIPSERRPLDTPQYGDAGISAARGQSEIVRTDIRGMQQNRPSTPTSA